MSAFIIFAVAGLACAVSIPLGIFLALAGLVLGREV